MKNPFASSSADDNKQRGERIAAGSSNPNLWFCYPNDAELDWQCQHGKRAAQPEEAPGNLLLAAAAQEVQPTVGADPLVPADTLASSSPQTDQQPAVDSTPPPESPLLRETGVSEDVPGPGADSANNPSSLAADAQRLLELPAEYFVVQLIALEDLTELLNYAASQDMKEPLIVRVSSANQQRLMVLLEGVYPDKQAAEQAAARWLLGNPGADEPWVRKLGTLQQAMREAVRDE